MQLLDQVTGREPGAPAATPPRALSASDRWPLLVLAALYAVMLAASWQRWTQPIVDHGREMHLPARILAGEQLYEDVQFLYGPFAPYFNALLYQIFGVHLVTLHVSGAACGALIVLLLYWLARQLMSPWEAAVAAGFALVTCAIKATANYVHPYAYAALYGLLFALAGLACLFRYLQARQGRWLVCAGACAGMALISKPEISAAAMAAAGVAILLGGLHERRVPWREAAGFALPVLGIGAAAYGWVLTRVPWRTLVEENHILFSNMPPQLIYFNRYISGLDEWPKSFWYTLTGVGMFGMWVGAIGLVGAVTGRGDHGRGAVLKHAAAFIVGGFIFWKVVLELFRVHTDATPMTAAPLILPALIGGVIWRGWRRGSLSQEQSLLLTLAAFGAVSLMRCFLNVKTTGPYVPFFVPALTILYPYLFFRLAPGWLAGPGPMRARVRRASVVLVALLTIGMAVNSAYRFRSRNTFEVAARRGRFVTEPPVGEPLRQALQYLSVRTAPGDEVLVLPQATAISFLAERRYPFFEEIVHPGFLEGEKEAAAIRRIEARRVPVILVVNLLTPEFRDRVFGVDYNRDLMRWITEHYRLAARFDSDYSRDKQFGDKPFFILAYERPE